MPCSVLSPLSPLWSLLRLSIDDMLPVCCGGKRFDWLMQQWKGKASFGGKEINHRVHRGCLTP
jgi:hypothetical protein